MPHQREFHCPSPQPHHLFPRLFLLPRECRASTASTGGCNNCFSLMQTLSAFISGFFWNFPHPPSSLVGREGEHCLLSPQDGEAIASRQKQGTPGDAYSSQAFLVWISCTVEGDCSSGRVPPLRRLAERWLAPSSGSFLNLKDGVLSTYWSQFGAMTTVPRCKKKALIFCYTYPLEEFLYPSKTVIVHCFLKDPYGP